MPIERTDIERIVREVVEASGPQEPEAVVPGPQGPVKPADGTIAIGSDHGGYELKEALRRYLEDEMGYSVNDVGVREPVSCDYPDYAVKVAEAVAAGDCVRGIMIDGAGIGSSMAANRVPGVLAACCHDVATVVNSREHNGANVLTLGSGVVPRGLARQMVRVWLATGFGGGRHERRVKKILDLEKR
ncbi:RpiB/LacA/LacB family sugar-phosphate isomerase [bacterium]|nr:RpiB/LacA/LacB family sugar-phosphate isomerase [bacterium]